MQYRRLCWTPGLGHNNFFSKLNGGYFAAMIYEVNLSIEMIENGIYQTKSGVEVISS